MWTTKDGIELWWRSDGFHVEVHANDGETRGQLQHNGARGWEWFELTRSTVGTVAIKLTLRASVSSPVANSDGKRGAREPYARPS